MRTKQWLFAALTVLLLAGCSTETDLTRTDDVNPSIPEGMTQLSFDIKGVRTGTSYVALTQDESQLKNLYVLLFPQSESGPAADAVCTVALKAKITTKDGAYKAAVLMDKTIAAGKYYGVLLANMNALMGEPSVSEDDIDRTVLERFKGETYTKLFIDKTVVAGDRNGDMPVATWGLGMKALVKDISVTEADRGDVIPLRATLTRPQARFDIKNTAYKSFTITGYQRKNVQSGAQLFFLGSEPEIGFGIVNRDPVTLTDAQKTLLNTPSFDHDGDAGTPLVMGYNPMFYCYPGQAADQSYVEITGELQVSSGGTRTVTYTIPLKTNTPDAYIAIASNKRYKIELKMTESEQLVGDVTMDAGSWDDEGDGAGNDNIEEQLPGEIATVTGATYDAATKTFDVAENINTFSFAFVVSTNTLQKAATAGIVDKVEVATATRVAPNTKYTVTLAATGTTGAIEEMGKDKDGNAVVVNTYKVKRGKTPTPPANVTGHTPVLYNGYWFVDASPEGQDNTMIGAGDTTACPAGWSLPLKAELIQILGLPTTPGWGESGGEEFATDFFDKVGLGNDYNAVSVHDGAGGGAQLFHKKDGAGTAFRCIQEAL